MASSCGAFHEEALRRQRVVDRKRVALARLAMLKEEEEQNAAEKAKFDEIARQQRHEDKMRELQEHLKAVKGGANSSKRKNEIPNEVMKTIKAKDKILRNNNLVLGHPKALWEAR